MNSLNKYLPKMIIFIGYLFLGMLFFYAPKIYELITYEGRNINVYTYADFISPETIQTFEQKTGIKVRVKYFDNDNELLAKFRVDQGRGYDLITATGFVINSLIKENLLKELDISKVSNYKYLDPKLLQKNLDPENNYSIPYFWTVDGIVFNKDVVTTPIDQIRWDLIFKDPSSQLLKNASNKIIMLDTPIEAFQLAAIYLFGKITDLTELQISQIKQLLINQKRWVDVYMAANLQYYLLSGVSNIAVTYTAFAKKMLDTSDQYKFVIPKEGSIITIDSFAIPKHSNKTELTYEFIDFLLSKEIFIINSKEYGYIPSNLQAYEQVREIFHNDKNLFPDAEMFEKLHQQHKIINPKIIDNLWLEVRLA
ncbi:extracellular solute-binding protein [Candidatus Dependentiae bacterium]|nr:extracellular solute-binding protein [Candidatus Dependentiae bacterium]